jgi:hypothetical protein
VVSVAFSHREFAMGCGEMSEVEFTTFLKTVFDRLAEHTIDGSIHQICMDWRHMWEMLAAGLPDLLQAPSSVQRWLTIWVQWLLFEKIHYHGSKSRIMPLRCIELF